MHSPPRSDFSASPYSCYWALQIPTSLHGYQLTMEVFVETAEQSNVLTPRDLTRSGSPHGGRSETSRSFLHLRHGVATV
jgi:hypothetical protein